MVTGDAERKAAVKAAFGAVATTTASVIPVFLVGGLAVQISHELGFSPAGLGVVVALYFAAGALCSIPAGWLVERYGDKLTSRAGVLLAAASMLSIAGLARSYLSLLVIMMVGAAGNSLGQLSSNLSLARQVPKHRQGLSFGVKQSAIPIATLLAGATIPTIALPVGWRWAFVVIACLALLALPLAPRGPRPPVRPKGGSDPRTERATGALVVLALGATLAAGSASALGIFLVSSAVAQGIGAGTAGLVLTAGSLVGVGARLGGGWLADRRGRQHILVVAATLAIGAGGLALLALPGMWTLVIGTVVGFGLGWSWPGVLNFAVVRLNPLAPAAATSITQAGVYCGGCLGPLVFGVVAARSYPLAWLVGAGAMVGAAVTMLIGRRLLMAHPSVTRLRRS
ncbi:MFS transporter [Pseudonocardia acaciae]|uniref:MFS transporter n=1 Tax=Pseudonocardia acaciae TaxID=551276 RepID=UPI0004914647|nr:MFS transporter [Pseudonocardia acaciae]